MMKMSRMNMSRKLSFAQYLLLAAAVAATAFGLSQISAQESASNPAGNKAEGKKIFEGAGNCGSCHRVGATGAFYGPNLSDVGARISPAGLRIMLNAPPEKIKPENRLYEVKLRNGKTVQGKLLNQDPFSIQLLSVDGQLVAYQRSSVLRGEFVDPPHMPSFKDTLTSSQIADLVAYLSSLRTPEN
jgi:putative heme-binding domain-containing protein